MPGWGDCVPCPVQPFIRSPQSHERKAITLSVNALEVESDPVLNVRYEWPPMKPLGSFLLTLVSTVRTLETAATISFPKPVSFHLSTVSITDPSIFWYQVSAATVTTEICQ